MSRNPSREILRCTFVGAVVNTIMGSAQAVGGLLFQSPALFADSLHTLTDLASDGIVALGAKLGQAPPDEDHPYGHGKFETLAQLIVAVLMVGTGVIFAIEVYEDLLDPVPAVQHAIWIAIATLIAKESLYRYTRATARRVGSRLLEANAWHHRTDAISSMAVVAALIGAQFDLTFLDPLAGLLITAAIVFTGMNFAIKAVKDLVEGAADEELIKEITRVAAGQDGVVRVHEIRARHIGSEVVADLHVLVDGRISVSDGHQVAVRVSRAVEESFPAVSDVLVHIDPEDDEEYPTQLYRSGADIEADVRRTLESVDGILAVSHITVHFLEGKTSVDLEIETPDDLTLREASVIASRGREALIALPDIDEADIHLEIDDRA